MKFSDLKIGEQFKGLGCVYMKIGDHECLLLGSLTVISADLDDEVEKVSGQLMSFTTSQQSTLCEMVWNAIESLQTCGEDREDNPWFGYYCELYSVLGGRPPAPYQEGEISPAARQSAIGLADDLIDIARNAGGEDD